MTRTKADWRRVLLAARSAMTPAARREAGASIMERVMELPSFYGARTLFGYVAIGAEADPRSLLEGSNASMVVVPAKGEAEDGPAWSAWGGSAGDQGLRVLVRPDDFPALAIVPGVGFDHAAMRLGRGQGFYDRALEALRSAGEVCVVGLAFESQIVPSLPTDPWDQPMDYVVTEERIILASRTGSR